MGGGGGVNGGRYWAGRTTVYSVCEQNRQSEKLELSTFENEALNLVLVISTLILNANIPLLFLIQLL